MPYRAFVIPRTIFYGVGALESLSTISAQRAFIVTDPGVRKLGLVDRVEKILLSQNIEVAVFDQVEADPSKDTAHRIFSIATDFEPDVFIGVGGGSAIDAGKAAWLFYEHPDLAEMTLLEVQKEVVNRKLHKKAKYIAISTTSGTGSEVSGATILVDLNMKPPLKVSFISPELKPDIAIADPELAATMPAAVTTNTGFDALVHALECYVLTAPSELVDPICIWAAKTIWEWLPKAVMDGRNMKAREKMHLASLQAGFAFSNGRIGSIHILAHEITTIFGVPHGKACAFMLCPGFAFLYPTHKARLSNLSHLLGFNGKDDKAKITNLLIGLDKLKKSIGIPLSLKEEIDESSFMAQMEPLKESYASYMNKRLAGVPLEQRRADGWPISDDEVKALYLHALNGTRADLR